MIELKDSEKAEGLEINKKAILLNPRKLQIKKDIEKYSKLTTQSKKIDFLAKKLGLIL